MTQQSPPGGANLPPPPPQYPQPPYAQSYGQAPYPAQPMMYAPAQAPTNGIGVAGGVVGIVAAALFWFPLIGSILGIIAVSLAGVGLRRANRMGGTSKGMSVTGIVCGSVALVLNVLILVAASLNGGVVRIGG